MGTKNTAVSRLKRDLDSQKEALKTILREARKDPEGFYGQQRKVLVAQKNRQIRNLEERISKVR